MATGKETEDAMVRALERRERAKSAEAGIFGVVFIAACAALIALSVHFNLGGWYIIGGVVASMAIAGTVSGWVMRGAKEQAPEKY